MTYKRILFSLDRGAVEMNFFLEEDWEVSKPLVEAMIEGAKAAGATVRIITSTTETEEV